MNKRWIFIVPAAIAGMTAFVVLGGLVVRLLWNWLLPPLFGWREITWLQGLGLLALCRILFGGFHTGRRADPELRLRLKERMVDRMADRVAERWDRMSPEDRERFRQRVRERCGFDPAAGDRTTP